MRSDLLGPRCRPNAGLLVVLFFLSTARAEGAAVFNVRDFGAKGDGKTLETAAIQKAIAACAAGGGGQVLLPPGKYLSATIQLKSHVTFKLDAGATLIGCPDPDAYDWNNLNRPGYHPTDTIGSFVGYVPADDPQFVVLVKLDKPTASPWGSQTAAPTFRAIAERLLAYLQIPPDEIRLAAQQ